MHLENMIILSFNKFNIINSNHELHLTFHVIFTQILI